MYPQNWKLPLLPSTQHPAQRLVTQELLLDIGILMVYFMSMNLRISIMNFDGTNGLLRPHNLSQACSVPFCFAHIRRDQRISARILLLSVFELMLQEKGRRFA